ncbi:MAG: ribosome biogenesis GTPase Der [Firmicutes bacterium]|nr:ribosome biogenesis GTPase Der [Bacillota bacterium]
MAKPIVAIVGRPNVGKSAFFNKVIGQNKSIVEDEPGVTRDRIFHDAEWCGTDFTLIDTGGINIDSQDEINLHIKEQVNLAIDISNCIIFLVDGMEGVNPTEIEISKLLRRTKKPIVLAVNKLDNDKLEEGLFDFYQLGMGNPFPVSVAQSRGFGDLLDQVVDIINPEAKNKVKKKKKEFNPDEETKEELGRPLNVAIVGKPNAGKSSIVNRLLGANRVMVSSIAGTTRDCIDTELIVNGKNYTLVDTAGIRRKAKVEYKSVEQYSVLRALAAIRRADVCVLVFDALEGLSEQDVRLAGYIHELGKPSVVVVNKWDIVEKDTYTMNKFEEKLKADLAFMPYFKSVYVSALTGQRCDKIIETVDFVYQRANHRITTSTLNALVAEYVAATEPPIHGRKRLKIYYATQVNVCPPTFVIKVNDAKLMHYSYKRYLENCLRRSVDFSGTPIYIILRNKSGED